MKFVDELPAGRGATGAWAEEAESLRGLPGQWAIITTKNTAATAAGTARNISQGLIKAFRPAGAFEGASRSIDGEFRVYARYVGEGDG